MNTTLRGRLTFATVAASCLVLGALAVVLIAASAASAAPPKIRSLGGGAWSWFGEPRGVHHRGAYDRSYLGWVDRSGNVKVASYDHDTRVRTTAVLKWALDTNDHANPSLHVRPDGRLMVFYNRHDGTQMRYRISSLPEDVRSWTRERTVPTNTQGPDGKSGYAYPNPLRLSAERGRLFLFWRGGNWQPSFSTTVDQGRTWSGARTLIREPDQRPYVKYASNGRDTIHFAFTQGNPGSADTDIHYAKYRGGALYGANGRKIKSLAELPLLPRQADKVSDTELKTWIHDIALDARGRPVVVFTTLPSDDDHRYHYARWTGTRWSQHEITPAGGSFGDPDSETRDRYYSGGITLDHENPGAVYLSREVNGTFEVETWRTADDGKTWSRQAVTSGSGTKNVRPISPRGLQSFNDDMSVVWMRGAYSTYLNYQTDITTRLLNGGNIPPIAEARAAPRSGGAPLKVNFDGSRSHDPDGSRLSYTWNFGDGTRGRGRSIAHTYQARGRYYATLTVTDAGGNRDVFAQEVTVY